MIEHVTLDMATGLSGNGPAAARPIVMLDAEVNGTTVSHVLLPHSLGGGRFSTPTPDRWLVSQPIRVYADPGTVISVFVDPALEVNEARLGRLSISGHFVDVP